MRAPTPSGLTARLHALRFTCGVGAASLMLAACGGADPQADGRRGPLSAAAVTQSSQTATDLYRFFVVAFGAAPGVTYFGQLQEAANAGMSIQQIVNVLRPTADHLYWPDLDVDLSVESIRHPERFPLRAKSTF